MSNTKKIKRVGLLTGGGDCPGLNAVIRAVTKRGGQLGMEIVGIKDGWQGLLNTEETEVLNDKRVSAILYLGGTILGSSRTNPLKIKSGVEKIMKNFKKLGLDALIVVGGEDTLGIAYHLYRKGIPTVGVPKTIDNDLPGTDFCIGLHSAVQNAMQRMDEIHSTAQSHHRVMVVEVMGRNAGWIATLAGIAGGADFILIPEKPANVSNIIRTIQSRHERGKNYSVITVAEGALLDIEPEKLAKILAKIVQEKTGLKINPEKIEKNIKSRKKTRYLATKDTTIDAFGHVKLGGAGEILTRLIEEETGLDTRFTNLGHILRGGPSTAFDRILGTRFGVKAIELVNKKQFGKVTVLRADKIKTMSLKKVMGTRGINNDIYKTAELFFY